jgi:hypothetical protein
MSMRQYEGYQGNGKEYCRPSSGRVVLDLKKVSAYHERDCCETVAKVGNTTYLLKIPFGVFDRHMKEIRHRTA